MEFFTHTEIVPTQQEILHYEVANHSACWATGVTSCQLLFFPPIINSFHIDFSNKLDCIHIIKISHVYWVHKLSFGKNGFSVKYILTKIKMVRFLTWAEKQSGSVRVKKQVVCETNCNFGSISPLEWMGCGSNYCSVHGWLF